MKKKRIILLFLFLCLGNNHPKTLVKAAPSPHLVVLHDDNKVGGYVATKPVNQETTVYISKEMVSFVESTGAIVHTKTYSTGWWIFATTHYLYYYTANEYVDEVVEVRKIMNDVDSMIFIIKQLEIYASSFISTNNIKNVDVSNLVLGYIRNINISYRDSDSIFESALGYTFKTICGEFNINFIDYVNMKESTKYNCENDSLIDIKSYFACFLDNPTNFNSRYGTIQEKYKKRLNLFDSRNNKIDLTHMFCVLDGLEYIPSENIGYQLQNLISFIGDLHTATYLFGEKNEVIIDFIEQILNNKSSSFSEDDLLADIDGYNLGRGYLRIYDNGGNRCNSISNALSAYYKSCENSSEFRYKNFIKNVAYQYIDIPVQNSAGVYISNGINSTGLNAFKFTVSIRLYLNPVELKDALLIGSIDPRDYLLCHPYNAGNNYLMPSYAVRKSMAKKFINYIAISAGYSAQY